jgi:aerobic carbon-monoxide dehydrogenase large subunit
LAEYDPDRRHWTLYVGWRGVFGFRNYIAGVLGIERTQLRVLTDRVGDSFGRKRPTYVKYYWILHAARARPSRQMDRRRDSAGRNRDRSHRAAPQKALALAGWDGFAAARRRVVRVAGCAGAASATISS